MSIADGETVSGMSRDSRPGCLATSHGWAGEDSNLRRLCRQIYSLLPLAARAPTLEGYEDSVSGMPTFDVVSQVDMQEVKNAVDQASREVTTRFDFKNTDSGIELSANE